MKETLNTQQVADALGVCPETVNRWVNRGIVPHVRLSRKTIRYYLEDVVKALHEWNAGRSNGQPMMF